LRSVARGQGVAHHTGDENSFYAESTGHEARWDFDEYISDEVCGSEESRLAWVRPSLPLGLGAGVAEVYGDPSKPAEHQSGVAVTPTPLYHLHVRLRVGKSIYISPERG